MKKQWKVMQLGSFEELERELNKVSDQGGEVVAVGLEGNYPSLVYYVEVDEHEQDTAKGKKKGK
jgi:hypothetical protein